MRHLRIAELEPGMVLVREVRNERGELLLNRSIELTETYLQLFQQNGIQAAYVKNPATEDIDIHGVISESVRHAVTNDLCRLFDTLDAFASTVRGKPVSTIASEIDAAGFGNGASARAEGFVAYVW